MNGKSIDDARIADGKIKSLKRENKLLDVKEDSKLTFEQLTEWYLNQKKVQRLVSYKTIKVYLNKFNIQFGKTVVADLKASDLENHQLAREDKGYKPKTIDNEICYVKAMLIKAFDNDKIDDISLKPFRKTKNLLHGKKRGSNARKRLLSRDELKKINEFVKEDHTSNLLSFGDWTGMRAGEVMKLKWSMVNLKTRIITLPDFITKEGREKKVPIGSVVYGILTKNNMRIRDAEAADHIFTYHGKPITRQFTTGLRTASDAAGIPWGREVEGGWIYHDLRRTFKTDMRKAGVHKSVIDSIVGHQNNNDMDHHYNIVDDQDKLQAMELLETYRDKQEMISCKVDHTLTISDNQNKEDAVSA
ncbi:MAG: tyrosine-type recombinase/integrase [Desulfobacterales bacterium]|nr:tyrosine-type recombinase/integrase [Desulfobacterales bacterium]